MKTHLPFTLVLTILCLLSSSLDAQTESENVLLEPLSFPRNELKINTIMLFFPALDVHYEYLINDENAIGASAQVSFNDYYFIPYQALGFYRFYFGKKPAAGFFIDLNASVYVFKKSSDLLESSDDVFLTRSRSESEFNGGLGVSIGVKYLTKRNVVVEMIYGFGRSIFNENFYPRFGITIGKRF